MGKVLKPLRQIKFSDVLLLLIIAVFLYGGAALVKHFGWFVA